MLHPDYPALRARILSLTEGETDMISLMATIACEVHHSHPFCDWTGFYRLTAPDMLKIGPYQGGHGCLTIPISKGVCGAVARSGQLQNVPDVDAFPGHIACASSTRSELVLPVWSGAHRLLGVFDLDSNTPAAFTREDEVFFTALVAAIFAPLS